VYSLINSLIVLLFILEIPDLELPDELTKTICLRAGSSLRLHITVTGRPIPSVTWSKPGVDLQNRGFIEVTNTTTTLIIDKVHRYDAGRYTIEASNSAGKKDASILVKIYGMFSHIKSCKLCCKLCIVHITEYHIMVSNQLVTCLCIFSQIHLVHLVQLR